MKLKKILAAVAAAAVAVSTMAVNAFAIDKGTYLVDDSGNTFLYLVADDGKPQWAVDNSVTVTDIYGVTWHATFNADEVANESAWIGGGIGANSNSTGWKQLEWGRNEKEFIADLENGTITWKSDSPIFKASDKYVQLWITAWGGTVTFDSADLLDANGNVIEGSPVPVADESTSDDNTAVADEAAPADDNTSADADVADDDADADIVDTDDDEDVDDDAADDVADTDDNTAVVTSDNAAPAADTTTAAAATGNVAVASIVAVMAVAGAAAIVSKKRQ